MNNDNDADDAGDDFGDDIVGLFYDNEILYFTLWCNNNKTRTVSSRVLNILLGLSGGQ